jgi:hypothetical protein
MQPDFYRQGPGSPKLRYSSNANTPGLAWNRETRDASEPLGRARGVISLGLELWHGELE